MVSHQCRKKGDKGREVTVATSRLISTDVPQDATIDAQKIEKNQAERETGSTRRCLYS